MDQNLNKYNDQFNQKGYVVVRNFLNQDLRQFIKNYFDIQRKALKYTFDPQVPNAKSFYSDAVVETLLAGTTQFYSDICGKKLGPTYSYSRIYGLNNLLAMHRDRPSCQYSATLCIARPEDQPNTALYFNNTESEYGADQLFLEPGDICFYRGDELYHWRDKIQSTWYLQAFLHYVDMDGEYANYLYDGRPYLGMNAL